MKRLILKLSLACIALLSFTGAKAQSAIYTALKNSEDVVSVEKLETTKFGEKYLLKIKQFVDHSNPERGTFTQRVVVGHQDVNKPVVLITEGYGGAYALNENYRDEIATKLECNQVVVEHRHFLESTPNPIAWECMTGINAANDLHHINTILRKIYKDKWISTGISKGGQTTMIYRTYFPDDVDISVPYVGPICFGVEDGRHEPFIAEKVGTAEQRAKILAYQREVLKRRANIVPLLEKLSAEKKWDYRGMTFDEVFDYCVLEYPFALWQWGIDTETIPNIKTATDKEMFDHLMVIASADYFGDMQIQSFYVQAAADLGYYGYDTKPFKGLLSVKSTKGYLRKIFLPKDASHVKFNNKLHKDIYKYLKNNDPKMIFIYGEYDPWYAAAPKSYLFDGKTNMAIYVEPKGSHKARIATMPADYQTKIWDTINKWLEE